MSVVAGALAGIIFGYVLQQAQLCFHATFAGLYQGRFVLVRGWLLAVAVASVGLAVLYLTPFSEGLNTGLAFAPVADVVGGLVVGVGMVVASTCVSGLFFKLGSGMLGALVGLVGWGAGELAARSVHLPGPTLLGSEPTIPQVLGVPRLVFALVFLGLVVAALLRWRSSKRPEHPWQWGWGRTGLALGVATVLGWVLARVGGSGFGPSTVGAVASVAAGAPNTWLLVFLLGIVAGAAVAARRSGAFRARGEEPVRYAQLVLGGFLLGAGGWIAGGCNLGHGLSGVAQMNVSSWVVVAAIVGGIGGARAVRSRVGGPPVRTSA